MKHKKILKTYGVDIIFDLMSAIIFSVAMHCFIAPWQVAPGGVSGISIMVNYLTGLSIGTVTFCINIPLLLLAWKFLGVTFTLRTLKTVSIQTLVLNISESVLPIYQGEKMMVVLFGGLLMGFALAIVFRRGSTTGGTDIVGRLLQRSFRHMSIGKLMMVVDIVIVIVSMAVFRNIETGLYAVIAIFAFGKALDSVLYGMNTGKMIMIISDKHDEISKDIMESIDRGVTLFYAKGGYSNSDKFVLMCAVRGNEYHKVEEVIKNHDHSAFVLTWEAGEIQGEGFRELTAEKVT